MVLRSPIGSGSVCRPAVVPPSIFASLRGCNAMLATLRSEGFSCQRSTRRYSFSATDLDVRNKLARRRRIRPVPAESRRQPRGGASGVAPLNQPFELLDRIDDAKLERIARIPYDVGCPAAGVNRLLLDGLRRWASSRMSASRASRCAVGQVLKNLN